MKVSRLVLGFIFSFAFIGSAQAFSRRLVNQDYTGGVTSPRASGGDTVQNYTGSPNHRTTYIPPVNGTCHVSCLSSATVQVDVTARCMCISRSKCFTVDIGYNGPGMTTNGHGTLGVVSGNLYHTYPGTGLTSLNRNGVRDNDAISMGISANDRYGKWIHKSRQCGAGGQSDRGGRSNTAGCIAIPCDYWPLVKSQMGQSLAVCRGNDEATTVGPRTHKKRRSGGT